MRLTGKRRHILRSVGWFRKRYVLVLQVEAWDIDFAYGCVHHVKRWRDATINEAMEIGAL